MKRYWLLALAAAVILSTTACSKQTGSVGVIGGGDLVSGEAQLPAPSSGSADESAAEDASEQDADAEESSSSSEAVPSSEYRAYRDQYLVPYGSLKFYDQDWTNAEDLGPDRIFEFTLQKNFNFYNSGMDYAEVFGDGFTYLQVPEKWADENYGLVYPQDIIENAAIEYFGVEKDFLRTAAAYIPAKSGYAAPPRSAEMDADASAVAELLPEVKSVTRNGNRAEITFTLSPCDALGRLTEGTVQTRVMVVEDKAETFRYVSVKSA